MKSVLSGLLTAIIIGTIGFIVLRSLGWVKLPSRLVSPSPVASPNFELLPTVSPTPTALPEPSAVPTTKGGITLGETYPTVKSTNPSTVTTTTTTHQVTVLRVFETSSCPVDGLAEIRDVTGPLTFKYSLKDGYSAKVTIWKMSGETVMNQTQISGSGILKTIDTRDNLKLQVVSHECSATSDTWLKLTAEK